MITAKRAREIARPKFDHNATKNILNVLMWINSKIEETAKQGKFNIILGLEQEDLTEYEIKQIKLRLEKAGYEVSNENDQFVFYVNWMKK